MVFQAIFAGAQAVGNAGNPSDPNVGKAAPVTAQHGFTDPIKGYKQDPRSDVAKVLDPGGVFLKGKLKFNRPELPSLKDLTNEARDVFMQNQSGFIADQLQAQRENFSDFFDIQGRTVEAGRSLMDRLLEGDLERRMATESIRGAQAQRGLSLSPAAAIQEGLAVSRAQQQSELQALGLGQQLADFSAHTPLQLQQLDFSQLLSTGAQRNLAQAGFGVDAQISNINLERDRRTANMAMLGRLAGQFGGSNVSTTQGTQAPTQTSSPPIVRQDGTPGGGGTITGGGLYGGGLGAFL
jgi:hypothetical protein